MRVRVRACWAFCTPCTPARPATWLMAGGRRSPRPGRGQCCARGEPHDGPLLSHTPTHTHTHTHTHVPAFSSGQRCTGLALRSPPRFPRLFGAQNQGPSRWRRVWVGASGPKALEVAHSRLSLCRGGKRGGRGWRWRGEAGLESWWKGPAHTQTLLPPDPHFTASTGRCDAGLVAGVGGPCPAAPARRDQKQLPGRCRAPAGEEADFTENFLRSHGLLPHVGPRATGRPRLLGVSALNPLPGPGAGSWLRPRTSREPLDLRFPAPEGPRDPHAAVLGSSGCSPGSVQGSGPGAPPRQPGSVRRHRRREGASRRHPHAGVSGGAPR